MGVHLRGVSGQALEEAGLTQVAGWMRWEAEGKGGQRERQKDGLTTDGAMESGEHAVP